MYFTDFEENVYCNCLVSNKTATLVNTKIKLCIQLHVK